MAIFKKIAKAGKYQDDNAIADLIAYITRTDKTPSQMIGGSGIDINYIAQSMVSVSEQFGKNSCIRLHHFIISLTPREARSPGIMICMLSNIVS